MAEKINKRILFVYPHRMLPVQGGGVSRSVSVIRALVDGGYNVELLTPRVSEVRFLKEVDRDITLRFVEDHCQQKHYIEDGEEQARCSYAEKKGEGIYYRNYDERIIDASRALMALNAYSFVYTNYLWTAEVLKGVHSDVCKIIDIHDLQYKRSDQFSEKVDFGKMYFCEKKFELERYEYADCVICITKGDASELRSSGISATIIEHAHAVEDLKCGSPPRGSKEILFVGNKYFPNEEGIRVFIETSMPSIRKAVPSACLRVVGLVCNSLNDLSEVDGVELVGWVDDLSVEYGRASVVVVPILSGTGMKIKAIEGLSYNKPVLVTDFARKGIDYFEEYEDQVFDEVSGMSDLIVKLLSHSGLLAAVRKRVLRFKEKVEGAECVNLLKVLNSWGK